MGVFLFCKLTTQLLFFVYPPQIPAANNHIYPRAVPLAERGHSTSLPHFCHVVSGHSSAKRIGLLSRVVGVAIKGSRDYVFDIMFGLILGRYQASGLPF